MALSIEHFNSIRKTLNEASTEDLVRLDMAFKGKISMQDAGSLMRATRGLKPDEVLQAGKFMQFNLPGLLANRPSTEISVAECLVLEQACDKAFAKIVKILHKR